MHFFTLLSTFATLSIFFANQAEALDVNIVTATCNFFTFTISVDAVDYQSADYATFYVANAANLDSDYAKVSYTINAGGDIYRANQAFTFNADIPGTPPGGSQWRIGVALDDSNGNALTYSNSEEYTYIANPCSSSAPSTTPAPSASSTIPASTSSSTSSSSTSPISTHPSTPTIPPNPTPPPVHINTTAIAGGVIGAVALLIAMGIFLCLRKRKASRQFNHQQSRSVDGAEKGYVSNDPIH